MKGLLPQVKRPTLRGQNLGVVVCAYVVGDERVFKSRQNRDKLLNFSKREVLEHIFAQQQIRTGELAKVPIIEMKGDIFLAIEGRVGVDHKRGDIKALVSNPAKIDIFRKLPIPAARIDYACDMVGFEKFLQKRDIATTEVCIRAATRARAPVVCLIDDIKECVERGLFE